MTAPQNGELQVPPPIKDMTDREIAEETLMWLRSFGQALNALQSGGMGSMVKGMLGRIGR